MCRRVCNRVVRRRTFCKSRSADQGVGELLQRHRNTEAAKTFLTRLLTEYDVPEAIHTDLLPSYGAAIREITSLTDVNHLQVISTARCNNLIEQFHRPTRC